MIFGPGFITYSVSGGGGGPANIPVFRGAGTAFLNGGTNTGTVSFGTTTVGDLLLTLITGNYGTGTPSITPPTGWTQLAQSSSNLSGSYIVQTLMWKFFATGDTSVTFSMGSPTGKSGTVQGCSFYNVNSSTPFESTGTTDDAGLSVSSVNYKGISSTAGNRKIVETMAYSPSNTVTPGSGWTSRMSAYNSTFGAGGFLHDKDFVSAGTASGSVGFSPGVDGSCIIATALIGS